VRRLVLIGTVAALVAAPVSLGLDRAQSRALVRVAVRLSGLSERQPVRVVVERPASFERRRSALLDRAYPRSAQAYDERVYRALGLTAARAGVLRRTLLAVHDEAGAYDPGTRTAYVRQGRDERSAALHQAVHALLDQNFRLTRVRGLRGHDAKVAATAAFEGYAELATRPLLGAGRPARRGSRLARFLELERGFTESVGLRLVADLRNLGGSVVALGALRRLPATTEQVFHLDKYLEREPAAAVSLPSAAAGLKLREAGTFGELDVRALLAVFGVPHLDRVGAGWGGGRTARYVRPGGEAVAVALAWDTEADAAQWAGAVALYVRAAFGAPARASCSATSCWQAGSRAVVFDRSGRRTAIVVGAELGRADALARAITGRL
jgi:hypothetical protein